MAPKAFRSEISIDIDCGAIATASRGKRKIVCERANKAGERPPAKLAKPAGGWDDDFVVNNFRV